VRGKRGSFQIKQKTINFDYDKKNLWRDGKKLPSGIHKGAKKDLRNTPKQYQKGLGRARGGEISYILQKVVPRKSGSRAFCRDMRTK